MGELLPLEQVLADSGTSVPSRSTVALTMPEEFELSTSRSAPTSPRSPSQSRSVAEQVNNFTKTPARFRSRAIGAPRTPLEMTTPKLTESQSMAFLTELRSTRPSVKSAEQIEEELMASIPKFKALPLNRKVLESVGDMGVPRVQRPAPTETHEFNLSSTNIVRVEDDDDNLSTASEPTPSFKARRFNKTMVSGPTGLAQITPRKMTRPRSPNFATSARAAARATLPEPEEEFPDFKARAIPAAIYSPRGVKPAEDRPITSPRPFNLVGEARRTVAGEARSKQAQEQARREVEARQFKARPMPVSDAWKPSCEANVTEAAPFNLSTETRRLADQERREQARADADAAAQRDREFHARPAKVVSAAPFVPRKSTKPLTEITGSLPPVMLSLMPRVSVGIIWQVGCYVRHFTRHCTCQASTSRPMSVPRSAKLLKGRTPSGGRCAR